jgi:beta-fructofuranosidase
MLQLPDQWVWDFWFAREGSRHHVFFLKAPKSLVDPDERHWNARIGHAVSDDLRTWQILPDALGPGPAGGFDDKATWTGSVLEHDGRWFLFYTGISAAERGLVQRIGLATSDDLLTWERADANPLVTTDPRWYEQLDLDVWLDETCRDPWVFPDPGGGFRMYFTARANRGPADERGVIGQAWSPDLWSWQVQPPLTEPGEFGHLEVPQLVRIGAHHYLVFSVYEWAHSAARQRRSPAVCGTHYLIGEGPLGPFRSPGDDFLYGSPDGPFYAGKLVRDLDRTWSFVSWAQFDDRGGFVGALADPVPVRQHADGTLSLSQDPDLGPAPLVREAAPQQDQ